MKNFKFLCSLIVLVTFLGVQGVYAQGNGKGKGKGLEKKS
jgi:hypothetical protein